MLIINEQDIEAVVDAGQLVEAIERAYRIQGATSTQIPDRLHLNSSGNTILVMPGWIDSISGTKLVSVFPQNVHHNKATINGLMVLNHAETGEPIACINGSKLTAVRTAAVGATAVKYLAPVSVKTLGIIGTGVQAYHQALIASTQRPFSRLLLFGRNRTSAEQMKTDLQNKLSIGIELTTTAEELVLESDVIVTATTSSKPVFELRADLLHGKTFIGIGSYRPSMREMPATLIEAVDKIYVDTPLAKSECEDLKIPLESGMIAKESNSPELVINAPSGKIHAKAFRENGIVQRVSFRNVPSFLYLQDQQIDVPELGIVKFDVAYGGAFYALSEAVIVNEEALTSYLSPDEIQAIRPNWGEISLRPTSSLSPDKREIYLRLLKDVMRTNNNQPLQEFLIAEGIISVALNDLAKESTTILEIIQKVEENLEFSKYEDDTAEKFQHEFTQLKAFLSARIAAGDYILMEFSD